MISAKIVEDSISQVGARVTTIQLTYPRFIHAELMTHRVFSRNASSSRAIPVKRMLEMIRNEPAMPIHWGKNQPGMQASEELTGYALDEVKALWLRAAESAAGYAEAMMLQGAHKQIANRVLEPFQHIQVLVTSTEWDNFFSLRAHPAAQPEIQALAVLMRDVMNESKPRLLEMGEWHLPYVSAEEREDTSLWANYKLQRISAARCARVSYMKHDGDVPNIDEDLALCERLVGSVPRHASPIEHQATPDLLIPGKGWGRPDLHGNFKGWRQYRQMI